MTDAKSKILELSEQRNRDGREPMTDSEVLEQLYRVRDGAASWLEQCVIYAKKDGIKEAQLLFNHAQLQISKIKRSIKRL